MIDYTRNAHKTQLQGAMGRDWVIHIKICWLLFMNHPKIFDRKTAKNTTR